MNGLGADGVIGSKALVRILSRPQQWGRLFCVPDTALVEIARSYAVSHSTISGLSAEALIALSSRRRSGDVV